MKLKNVLPIIAMLLVVLVTGCKKDDNDTGVRPTVTSTDPMNEATGIAINSVISATFSESMDPSTLTTSTFLLEQGIAIVTGTVEYVGENVTFTPDANLAPNATYSATITTGAKNLSGKPLTDDYIWTFTTSSVADIAHPTVTQTEPLNSATEVAINRKVLVTFSEPMEPTTITGLTFTLNQGSTPVTGEVTYTGTTATFSPSSNLEPSTIYTATITTGAMDMTDNALAANYIFSFTTGDVSDNTLPTISSTNPLNNATGVARNKVIALTFSEAMNPETINATSFTLMQGSTIVSGTIAYSGTTATFTSASILGAGLTYTATITTEAKDLAGNALETSSQWSFTTSTTSILAVVNLGAAGNYVILAKTKISTVPTSAITGNVGLSPAATSYITGFALTNATGYATSPQVIGKIYAANMAPPTPINLTTAVENMITAYNDAAGRSTPDYTELGTGNLGGKTLTPGLYKWTSNVTIPSAVTISGGADDVWIFQISGNLLMSSAVSITLSGGAQAKNIFWQVAGQATFGANSHFEGIILSMTGITLQTGASMNGRALAQTAVVLDANIVKQPK
jgi:methionine-rich copper-binding protein CopC